MKRALLSSAAAAIIFGLAACGTDNKTAEPTDDTNINETESTAEVAAKRPVFVGVDGGNVAVSGYDAVSYFSGDGVPVKGDEQFNVEHGGAVYHFASSENAAKFKENPMSFTPQYGGHCAWAMANGNLAGGDPLRYKIVDGKLYLNFNEEVQKKWLKDIAGFIEKADLAWPNIPDDAKVGG